MISPEIGPREYLYKNIHQEIYRAKADFGAYQKEYYVTDTGPRAGIVAIQDGCVLLVRQYRFLVNDLSCEIPGGKVDQGESPEESAIRECMEETGVRCLNPRPLLFYHLGLDTDHNPTHLFYSDTISEKDETHRIDQQEISSFEWIPLALCIEMIFKQEIQDSFSIIALFTYQSVINEQ